MLMAVKDFKWIGLRDKNKNEDTDICDVFYRKQTHLGKKSKLRWLLIMKVEIFSFTMIAFLF